MERLEANRENLEANIIDEEIRRSKSLDRLVALSDGIFAFAITLLALDLVTPIIVGAPSDSSLVTALSNEFHSFLGFFVSFWTISMFWVSHHRIFSYIKKYDPGLARLNLIFLFFIVLVPFATRVLNYGFLRVALDVFASVFVGASLMISLIWKYASAPSRHLLYDGVSQRITNWLSNRGFITASFFVLSIFFAFINSYLTLATWLIVFPVLIGLDKRYGTQ